MHPHGPPDLVVFDVDGTLHDTFRWWVRVLHEGLRRYADAHGVAIELPDDELACSVVGMKDEGVWGPFLPPDRRDRWQELREIVVPLECAELFAGRDHLFAGVERLLARLRGSGVPVAIASNCRARYFDAVCRGQRLAAWTDWQFCLDSPGIADKTDMLHAAVAAAGAARPIMVGDREPDLEAARMAGMPFVWRRNPRCDLEAASEAVWNGGVDEFLELCGLGASPPGRPQSV